MGREHYLNQPLNRCARLMAAGHDGQALISRTTEPLVREDLPEGATWWTWASTGCGISVPVFPDRQTDPDANTYSG